jgi:hypothetical protein
MGLCIIVEFKANKTWQLQSFVPLSNPRCDLLILILIRF